MQVVGFLERLAAPAAMRRWSDEAKGRKVAETLVRGVTVNEAARVAGTGYGSAAQPLILSSNQVRIMVAAKPIDFHKGHESLAAMEKNELHKAPFTGTVFVVRAKTADGTGLVMACIRPEEHSFTWPAVKDGLMQMNRAQLTALFAWLDWQPLLGQ